MHLYSMTCSFLKKAQSMPNENRLTAIKSRKVQLRIRTRLLRQNAVALSVAPSRLPTFSPVVRVDCCSQIVLAK